MDSERMVPPSEAATPVHAWPCLRTLPYRPCESQTPLSGVLNYHLPAHIHTRSYAHSLCLSRKCIVSPTAYAALKITLTVMRSTKIAVPSKHEGYTTVVASNRLQRLI
ncbi:hypothetical protein TRVL_09478 [Trypanosoma vivax]|nr:hypothetical protein TRVL_09478 [Trypanosoma vivax]